MQELALKIIKPFVAALLILALLFIARQVGYSSGYAAANDEHQKADIESLNKSISDLNAATKKAGEENLRLGKTINAKIKADQLSTRDFINELKATSDQRVNCVFPDSIMQKLFKAADSANQAASSGFGNSVPASHPPN